MSASITSPPEWTAVDLAELLGPIPLYRICMDPAPGTGTESDIVHFDVRDKRLFELFRGVLVEKAMGFYESYLAGVLLRIVGVFVDEHRLGIVAGADGIIRLAQGLIRIPDVAFYSFQRLPGGQVPSTPIADLVPDLAIEVLSRSNTREEMDQKLKDYFEHGVRLVWYVEAASRHVKVFTDADTSTIVAEGGELSGGAVLPGFYCQVSQLFQFPQANQ